LNLLKRCRNLSGEFIQYINAAFLTPMQLELQGKIS
jgi:hypothetical protein